MDIRDKIIPALDVESFRRARHFVYLLSEHVQCFKIGTGMTLSNIKRAINFIHGWGRQVLYDGKLHDTPSATAREATMIARMGVKMFTIHASSGIEAMKAAVEHKRDSLMLAVTCLTTYQDKDRAQKVVQLAREAYAAGADGVVCATDDLLVLKRYLSECDNMLTVVPGIRPAWAQVNEQKRIGTPAYAIACGADKLVMGRPILYPPAEIGTPINAMENTQREIEMALALKAEKEKTK